MTASGPKEMLSSSLSELVATRLCHDLAGPIGALNNGVEFLADGGADMAAEAADLLAMSAQEARAKLQLFRMAYGVIHAGGKASPGELKEILESYFSHSKIKPAWEIAGEEEFFTADMRRLLANMVLVISGALLAGGTLEVMVAREGGKTRLTVRGTGAKIKHDPEVEQVLRLTGGAEPSSRLVPALLIAEHGKAVRARLDYHAAEGHIHLEASLP